MFYLSIRIVTGEFIEERERERERREFYRPLRAHADVLDYLCYVTRVYFSSFPSRFSGAYFDRRMSRVSTNKFEICGASASVLRT